MGCWNGTCGLTNLPIFHGDEVYVFPIIETHRGGSFCYSTALYRPSVLPFRAKYNDYGAGEDCHGVGLSLLMKGIAKRLVELEVGENKYHDIAVKRDGFDVDKFFEACHEKRLLFMNPMRDYEAQPKHNHVFFTMIRKDVLDRLWSEFTFDKWKPEDETCIPESFETNKYYVKNVTYEKLEPLIPSYVEHLKSNIGKLGENAQILIDEYVAKGEIEVANGIKKIYGGVSFRDDRKHMLSGMFGHMFSSGYCDGGFADLSNVQEAIKTAITDNDNETAYALLKECMVGYLANSVMSDVRKIWTPPMHQGSQDGDFTSYRLVNKIMGDIMDKSGEEWAE